MGIFKKRGDVLDLTLLQKRGILKNTENGRINEITDVLNLTKKPVESFEKQAQTFQSPFDILDNVSQSSTLSSLNSQSINQFDLTKKPSNVDLQDFKVKIDDFEYKLNRFLERLEKLEEKINRQ